MMKKLVPNGCSFLKFVATLLLLSFVGTVLSQQIGPSVLNLDDVTAQYPRPWDREALVVLDFTVKSDGSIDDIAVVDGFFEDRFVDAAIAAARQLRFKPASERGEAVDWPGFRLSTRFVIRNMFHTMGPNPNSELTRAEELMRENKADEAEALLKKALEENTRLYFEDAVFHLRLGEIYLATNRAVQAVHALDRASQTYLLGEHNDFNLETAITHNRIFVVNIPEIFTDDFMSTRLQAHYQDNVPRAATPAPLRSGAQRGQGTRSAGGVQRPKATLEVLNNTLLESAYQRGYVANISSGNVKAVLNVFDNLLNLNEDAVSEQMEAQAGQVRQLMNASQRLTSAKVIERGETLHYPVHRILAAVNVTGNIETLDFQCGDRVIRLAFQAEVEWNMPESWGECAMRFRGDDGTTFNIVEFPE
jgi:tetratricopeptide (TPR) repeat protein